MNNNDDGERKKEAFSISIHPFFQTRHSSRQLSHCLFIPNLNAACPPSDFTFHGAVDNAAKFFMAMRRFSPFL